MLKQVISVKASTTPDLFLNLILFDPEELCAPLPRTDSRAIHILEVLKVAPGGSFDVGKINGPRGKARLEGLDKENLVLEFVWKDAVPELNPLQLLVGLCRPQTCRKILRECTSMGFYSITFFNADRSEPAYQKSRLWATGEARRLMIKGAEQAFSTRLPELHMADDLENALRGTTSRSSRVGLDNYEGEFRLGSQKPLRPPVILAVGSERGWTARERDILRDSGFQMAHLGNRVLRTETACIAAASILLSQFPNRQGG